jgi:hypothetical protein
MCDVTVLNGSAGSCTNFDGNKGSWVWVGSGDLTLPSAGSGKTAFGDIAISADSKFDQANAARTFQLRLGLQQTDTNKQIAQNDLTDSRVSNPFNAVVVPAALIELNVIPQTILYHPPGNQSTVIFSTGATYGTSFTLGKSTETSNKRTDEQSGSTKVGIAYGFGDFGFAGGATTKWDHSVSEGFGTTAGSTTSESSSLGFKGKWSTFADQHLIPGSGDTCGSPTNCRHSTIKHDPNIYAEEPFWEDMFVLLVHPQFAVWVEGGEHNRFVMYGAVPVTANVTVAELFACANGLLLLGQDPCVIEYSNTGLTSPNGKDIYYSGSSHTVTLTHNDASSLLLLDPFYEGGQGAPVDVTRGLPITSKSYGGKIGQQPVSYTETLTNTQATMQGQNKGTRHSTSIVDLIGNSSSEGVSINKTSGDDLDLTVVVGENGTFEDSDNTTYEKDMTATFNDSTAVSTQVVTTAEVTLNDVDNTTPGNDGKLCTICHDPLPQRPQVNILLDRVFGSLMFQDPDAPAWVANPLTAAPAQLSAKLLQVATLQEQSRQRFSDVPNDSPAKAAIGLLARTQIMPGLPDGTFQPDAPLTKGQLAAMMAKALNLPVTAGSSAFADVAPDDPIAPSVAAAAEAGLLVTPFTSMFGANDPVSRQEMAATLARAFKLSAEPPTPPLPFRDEQQIASWAANGVQAVTTAAYLPGFPDGTFRPAEAITRASAALALLKVLETRQ